MGQIGPVYRNWTAAVSFYRSGKKPWFTAPWATGVERTGFNGLFPLVFDMGCEFNGPLAGYDLSIGSCG